MIPAIPEGATVLTEKEAAEATAVGATRSTRSSRIFIETSKMS
jgi:hypothetical protein